jgi:glycosyltransferase involved in cell wall biosynthesis
MPPDEGGRVRAYNLVKQLSLAHDVLVLSPRSSAYADWDLHARVAQTTSSGRVRQIVDLGSIGGSSWRALREFVPDVIVTEYPWAGLRAWIMARRLHIPLVFDAPNVEGERFRSTGSRVWRIVDLYERMVARSAAAVFAVSEEDVARFRARGIAADKIQIVPNGVDSTVTHPDSDAGAAIRRQLGIGDTTKMLLFFGQLGYTPNRDAISAIHGELLPRLDRSGVDYVFVVAGKNHEAAQWTWSHLRLRYTGPVTEIAAYINAADAVTVPVTSGGGTRLKMLESVACGTPVVSTTVGAEGIDRAVCEDLLTVVDDWDGFAEALGRAPVVKRGNVPAAFLDMYSWAGIVSRIEWPT